MCRLRGVALVVSLILAAGNGLARAEVVVAIDKSKQQMTVLLDGVEQHVWKVSTGLAGGPPSGAYKPARLARKWYSRKYNWSPMPHSIFFHEGYAVHGTNYISRLGHRASHGCVRLHPKNAATLYELVKSQGMRNVTIVVANTETAVRQLLLRKATSLDVEVSAQNQMSAMHIPAADAPDEFTGATPAAAQWSMAREFGE